MEPLNADTFGTREMCPDYGGVLISGVLIGSQFLNITTGDLTTVSRGGAGVREGAAFDCRACPSKLLRFVFHFLTRSQNKGVAEVTGAKVYRGAGYGHEIPFLWIKTLH